jgi:hypothetical protein
VPVVVDGGLADAGALRDCVHAGGVDTALCHESESGFQNFAVGMCTLGTRHLRLEFWRTGMRPL